ncbi:YoaK family protein [Paraburkholderia sp. PREW-6R]|uniref:YoaK family protein n=1 Tax=Paraburkholderia sp. PREW-6R TaxID=3141544 RepID=UPI0031F5B48A
MPPVSSHAAPAPSPLPLCLLVAVAGMTDSLMFMHSSDLLAVYMSGNTSKLARSLALGQWPALAALAGVIAAFFATTTVAAWLGKFVGRWRATLNLALTAVLLCVAWPLAHEQYSAGAVMLIAAAMGALNQVLADEPGVTFITGALVRLSRSLVERDAHAVVTGVLRWLAWLAGAMIGTLLDIRVEAPTLLLLAIGTAMGALICAFQARLPGTSVADHS